MGKDKLIPVLAIIFLIIGLSSSLYVHAKEQQIKTESSEYITFKGVQYNLEELFSKIEQRTIETDEGEKTGIALDIMIMYMGIDCSTCHSYVFKAKDSYQQTVSWENIQNGILTEDSRAIFSDTAHALWVRDVIEIEVN